MTETQPARSFDVPPVLAAHAPLTLTLPAAMVIGLALLWYGIRLGRPEVPVSRRWIRRVSIVFMLVSLPMFVRGMSVLDSKANPGQYVATWTMAIVMIGLVMLMAMIDAMNNLRIHRRMRREVVEGAMQRLVREIVDRQKAADTPVTHRDSENQS